MAIIKCSECGREIDNEASACMYCGNPMETNKKYKTFNTKQEVDNDTSTEKTIDMFFNFGSIILIGGSILGLLLGLLTLMSDEPKVALVFIIAFPIGSFIMAFVFGWMAHMLQNIYEINKNTRK